MGKPVCFGDSGWDELRAQHREVALVHPIVQVQAEWGPAIRISNPGEKVRA
jgi:hypothetical protein